MAASKWSWILLLGGILLIGLPIEVKCETPTDEIKPSSVKECRVHIEKALEQYWEHKEPVNEDTSNVDQNNPINKNERSTEDDFQTSENDENLRDKTEENHSYLTDENDSKNGDENLSIDNEEDEEDIDEEEENEENIEKQSITDDSNIEESSENSVQEEEEEEDDEEDEEEEDTSDEEEDTSEEEEDKLEEETENRLDESPAGAETEERGNETHKTEVFGESQENIDNQSTLKAEEEQSTQEYSTEEDEEEDEEEDNEEDEDEEEETSKHNIENENEDKPSEESSEKEAEKENREQTEDYKTESEEVTGETDRASAGVASELPSEEPPLKQPEAPEVTEETSSVTAPEEVHLNTTKDDVEQQKPEAGTETGNEIEEKDDDTIENIYEEVDDDDSTSTVTFRSRDHVDVILGLDEIGTEYDKEEEKLAQSIFREIKKIELTMIKPMEMLYKYADSTSRFLGDAEIFAKPMILFLGPWSAGKTTIINYLLGLERTPAALKTGTGITDVDFSLITYGDQRQVISGTELVADWKYAGLQKFGQGFLDHLRSIHIPHTLLRKVTIVDTPGILENRKNTERGYPFNDAFQWFIDRADAIYVVLDPTKVDIGGELGSVLDQLKGRDVRFILNKADTIRRSDLMRVVGQLFWNLSPLMSSTEAPVIYAVSLTTKPYHPSAPVKFLADQEKNFLYDMKDTLDRRIESRILYARRHAVRVRNHANMVDCYLATYYRHKSIFSNKRNVAKLIAENPREYNIFEGLSSMTNVSRYDLPDPKTYKEFFKLHPLYDFKPLASTCSYFRGCPMDKVDAAISKEIPELFAKYKKAKNSFDAPKQEGR